MAARRYTLLDVFTSTRLQGNPLAVVHDADDVAGRDHARVRARDAAVGDVVRADAAARGRRLPQPHLDDGRRGPVRRPSVARRGRGGGARARRDERHLHAGDRRGAAADRRRARRRRSIHASMLQEPATFGPELDPAEVLGAVGLERGRRAPRAAVPGRLHRASPRARARARRRRAGAACGPTPTASPACSLRTGAALPLRRRGAIPTTGTARARSFCGQRRDGRGPATGSAAGPLCAYLAQRTGAIAADDRARASRWAGASRLVAQLEGERVRVGGDAVVVLRRQRVPGHLIEPAPRRLQWRRAPADLRIRQDTSQERGRREARLALPTRPRRTRRRGSISCPGAPAPPRLRLSSRAARAVERRRAALSRMGPVMEARGIEPLTPACKAGVFPLAPRPRVRDEA